MCANEREQSALALLALGSHLRKAGRDHADRSHAGVQRRLHGIEHSGGWNTENRKLDRIGNLGDRAVASDARDRLPLAIDRIRGAVELTGEDVAEKLAADRSASRRGAHYGNRVGLEERT